jgi:hypothetical protein
MTILPSGFNLGLDCRIASPFLDEATTLAHRLVVELGFAHETALALGPDGNRATLELSAGVRMVSEYTGGEYWVTDVSLDLHELDPAHAVELLHLLHSFTRAELGLGLVEKAELSRTGSQIDCFPLAPIVRNRHLFATKTPVDEYYAAPDALESCPDLTVEQLGAHVLVTRALDAISDRDFVTIALPQAWHLARAAKPAVVTYGGQPSPELQDIYKAAPRRLEPVGYDAGRALAEYACYLEPDEHIAGWEIDGLHRMLRDKKFTDGRAVREVRVAFANRVQAEREKRPLLDGGVKVVYVERGADHTLTDG